MARETRTFTETRRGSSFSADAYTEDNGKTWRWVSNDSYCPLDACRDMNIPCDPAAQTAARDKQNEEFFAEYRERMKNHQHSAEELSEMRAAFGPGTVVVNVITGKKTRL